MTNEIQVGAAILTGAEVLIATLATWHPLVDVYVDGTADPRVLGSHWNVYAVTAGTRTRIASGTFDAPAPLEGQRVLSAVPGDGTSIELRAFTPNGTTSGPIRAAIVGWDTSTATTNPSDAADAVVSLLPGPETVIAPLVWHPEIAVFVTASAQALGSFWRVRAVIPGFAVNVPVASGVFQDVQASRLVVRTGGGAASWLLTASAPAGPTGLCAAAIFGKSEFETSAGGGVANVTASLPITSSGGPNPNIAIVFPLFDGVFGVANTIDPTKTFKYDLSGQAAATQTTFFTTGQANRAFRTPDIDGTAVVQQDATGFVFLSVPPVNVPLHGSDSRVQLSSLVTSGAQFRGNQYGANAGVPGISTFKSRGATIGSLAGVNAGDVLFGITCVGVAPDNVSIPLAGLAQFLVPTAFVPVAQNWVPTNFEIQVVPLAGPINGRRVSFRVTSEGETQTLRGVRAGGPAATPANFATVGTLWSSGAGSPEGAIVGSPGDLWSNTAGGVGTSLFMKEAGAATNAGWRGVQEVIAAGAYTGEPAAWDGAKWAPSTTLSFGGPGPFAGGTYFLKFSNAGDNRILAFRDGADTVDINVVRAGAASIVFGDGINAGQVVVAGGGDLEFDSGAGQPQRFWAGANLNFKVGAGGLNAAFFGEGSYGTGSGVVSLANATTAPTTNPVGGGIDYANAGARIWRGSAGTVTAMAPA